MPLQLARLDPGDNPSTGRFVFICLNEKANRHCYDIRNYWLVVIISDSLAPNAMLEKRPEKAALRKDDHVPVWVIGKGKFLWVKRSAMYYLNDSQLHAFADTESYNDFATYYALARERHDIDYFEADIANDRMSIDRSARAKTSGVGKRDSSSSSSSSEALFCALGIDEDDDGDEGDQPFRKRARTEVSAGRSERDVTLPPRPASLSTCTSLPTPAATGTPSSTPATTHVKPELDVNGIPIDQVEVYIGNPARKFHVSESALAAHSPTLSSYIQRPPKRVPRIMDPDLMTIDPEDFAALAEWLDAGEFAPLFLHVGGMEGAEGSGRLEGIDTAAEAATEVDRLGGLYILALRFGVLGMQQLVLKKLRAGFPGGWDVRAMLQLVAALFDAIPGRVDDAAAVVGEEGKGERDPLKAWLVEWLGRPENVEAITTGERKTARLYWDTLNRAVGLRLAVSREGTRAVERWKGVRVEVE